MPSDDPPPEDFDYGERREDGQYEQHPTTEEGDFVQPVRTSYTHEECGSITHMSRILAESFARDPNQYGKTFCANCGDYYPLAEFTWTGCGTSLTERGPPVDGALVKVAYGDTVQAYAPDQGVKAVGEDEAEAVAELRPLLTDPE